MKTITPFCGIFGIFILSIIVFCPALPIRQALAEEDGYSETYSREELTQMLAPVALYPDALLAQILMASTYPIEVVEADRWVRRNPGLEGEELDDALLDMDWDPSVKAVCHFPSILALMSERISEVTDLGNAFLAQEDEVMDVVQELRAKAYEQGHLTTNDKQKVIVKRETIIIEQADPRVVYVSYYDPRYVYGPWWLPAFPPFFWGPPGVRIGAGISYWPGFYFGFTFGSWSYFDWHRHYIHIDVNHRPRFVRHDRWVSHPGRWAHAPVHRRGLDYHDRSTARKYGQHPPRHRDLRHAAPSIGVPDHRGHERREHIGDRNGRDYDQRGEDSGRIDRIRIERERQEQRMRDQNRIDRDHRVRDRSVREGQVREDSPRDHQRQDHLRRENDMGAPQLEREKHERHRIEGNRQSPAPAASSSRTRERSQQEFQERMRIKREQNAGVQPTERVRQERHRLEGNPQAPETADSNGQERKRDSRGSQEQGQLEREQQKGRHENNFNRGDAGRMGRHSNERNPVNR